MFDAELERRVTALRADPLYAEAAKLAPDHCRMILDNFDDWKTKLFRKT